MTPRVPPPGQGPLPPSAAPGAGTAPTGPSLVQRLRGSVPRWLGPLTRPNVEGPQPPLPVRAERTPPPGASARGGPTDGAQPSSPVAAPAANAPGPADTGLRAVSRQVAETFAPIRYSSLGLAVGGLLSATANQAQRLWPTTLFPVLGAVWRMTPHPEGAEDRRHALQQSLQSLTHGSGVAPPSAQAAAQHPLQAHEALARYSAGPTTWPSAVAATGRDAYQVGVGSASTFSVGLAALGTAAGSLSALRAMGRETGGFHGEATPLGTPSLTRAAAQWTGMVLGGSLFNAAGTPLAAAGNAIASRMAPVPVDAVVPPSVAEQMNQLEAGAGDRLRQAVMQRQQEVSSIAGEPAIRAGQAYFGLLTGARMAAQGPEPLNPLGQFAWGLPVSAVAGALTGANRAVRSLFDTIAVPDPAELARAVASGQPLDSVPTRPICTFYLQHGPTTPAARAVAEAAVARLADPAPRPRPGEQLLPAPDTAGARLARVVQPVSTLASQAVERIVPMAEAAAPIAITAAVLPFITTQLPPSVATGANVLAPSLAITGAVRSWFTSLGSRVPQGDARLRAERQAWVDRQAAAHGRSQPPAEPQDSVRLDIEPPAPPRGRA